MAGIAGKSASAAPASSKMGPATAKGADENSDKQTMPVAEPHVRMIVEVICVQYSII